LLNKLGDLQLKTGKVSAAVDSYERAANRYAESGFPNNAIALCNKILRASPGRTPVYLKLAKLQVERGFVADAKRNLLEYAQRMQKAGQLEEAFTALKEFADLSPNNEEIRLLLAEQLKAAARTDEARDQLAKLYAEVEARGDQRRTRSTLDKMKAIDPDFDAASEPKAKVSQKKQKGSDLVFLDLDEEPVRVSKPVPEPKGAPAKPAPPKAAPAPAPKPAPKPAVADLPLVAEPEPEPVARLEVEPTSLVEEEEPAIQPLEIETTSLAEEEVAPAEIESLVEPELVGEVPQAPGFERTSLAEIRLEEPVEVLPDVEPTAEELPLEIAAEEPEAAAPPELEEVSVVGEGAGLDLEFEAPETAGAGVAELDLDIDVESIEIESEPAAAEASAAPGVEVPELDLGGFEIGEAEEKAAAAPAIPPAAPPATPEPAPMEKPTEPLVVASASDSFDLGAEIASELEAEEVTATVMPSDATTLEDRVAASPDDASLHRALAEALLEKGERERGLEELDLATRLFEEAEEWESAESVTDEIIRLDPNSVRHHQKRVEYAFRSGDKHRLVDAYLGLADSLFRSGSADRSRAVYKRVLEHDPNNEAARLALDTLEPAVPEPAKPAARAAPSAPAAARSDADFVDLGAMLLEEEPALKDTRMRIQEEEPTGDEERDFQEMLAQFKKGIEENIEEEDWQAHYDMGIAFKEMGLLDEAIGEFQKALRSPAGRLRAAEALGLCFFEKAQFSVAATVLRRAVDAEPGTDEQKIGLLYWLGRCEEEQAHVEQALVYYQRVFAVDIKFQDVSARVQALAGASR
jgi:tetratricopeptide (TPR) repeat protein